MVFKSIFHNETSENTYLLYDEETKNAVIIDPGCKIEKIENLIEENGVKVKYILLTHCHYDHIESLIPLKEKTGAKIVTGDNGSKNIGDINKNLSTYALGYPISGIKSDVILSDYETLALDSLNIKCIYTPGHTDCCVCYLCENELFAGDTLFLRSVGRWDLPTGDFPTLEKSIKEKLYTLPDEINVHPGHGGSTTIGYEKKYNFCVKI